VLSSLRETLRSDEDDTQPNQETDVSAPDRLPQPGPDGYLGRDEQLDFSLENGPVGLLQAAQTPWSKPTVSETLSFLFSNFKVFKS
jgi:hypothetical protein